MNSAESFRLIVILIGIFVTVAAAFSVGYYLKRWRTNRKRSDFYLMLRGVGSLIGLIYVVASLIEVFDKPEITWRAPVALLCFICVVIAITGTYSEEEHF